MTAHTSRSDQCYSGNCEEGLCITSLTLPEAKRLGPSSRCNEKNTPCHNGKECSAPRCNIYGNSWWCPQTRENIFTRITCPITLCKADSKCCHLETKPDGWLLCPKTIYSKEIRQFYTLTFTLNTILNRFEIVNSQGEGWNIIDVEDKETKCC